MIWIFFFAFSSLVAVEQHFDAVIDIGVRRKVTFSETSLILRPSTSADLNKGYLEKKNAIDMRLSANTAWELLIRSDDPHMGVVGGKAKPISDLQWKRKGSSGAYKPLTGSDEVVDSRSRAVNRRRIRLHIRVLMDWIDGNPGSYSVNLLFTHREPV